MFTIEEVIEWDSKGWIIGSSITSREIWMKWEHSSDPPRREYILSQEYNRYQWACEYWRNKDRTSPAYFEIIKKWPLKDQNDRKSN